MIPKKQKFNRIPNGKLVLASSLVVFGCTQVLALPPIHTRDTETRRRGDAETFGFLSPAQMKPLILSGSPRSLDALLPRVPTSPRPRVVLDDVESSSDRTPPESRIFAAPPLPPGTGTPGRREGRGSRGCEIDSQISTTNSDNSEKKPLIALVPAVPINELPDAESVGGYTTAEHPTFWFYVNYQPPLTAKFVLQDRDQNLVYKTDVTLPGKPGAYPISLPTTTAPLTAGKVYFWYFKVYCQPGTKLVSFVEGWIQRTSLNPAVERQLQNATPQQKIALYGSNGIWYEALNVAAELRRTNSSDRNWANLLQDLGLSKIASEAIVEN